MTLDAGNEFAFNAWRVTRTRSRVVCLFRSCGPATVGWFIVTVIVNAINSVLWRWSSAHIRQKGNITIAPSLTYTDAASAVILPGILPGIRAALYHYRPDTIFSSAWFAFTTSLVVYDMGSWIALKATTAFYATIKKMGKWQDFFSATVTDHNVTFAKGAVRFSSAYGLGRYDQTPKPFADNIKSVRSFSLGHGDAPLSKVRAVSAWQRLGGSLIIADLPCLR